MSRVRIVITAALAALCLAGLWAPAASSAPAPSTTAGKNAICLGSLGIGTLKLLPAGICIPGF